MTAGRRRLVGALAAAALAAPAARAQPAKPARVVALARSPIPEMPTFRDAMRELGHVEGTSYVLEEIDAGGGDDARLSEAAARAMRGAPAVIWAGHGEAALQAKRVSSTIPIVFNSGDPVALGLAASLARPGGNATGIQSGGDDIAAKRMEVLHDAFPAARRIAFLHPDTASTRLQLSVLVPAAAQLRIELLSVLMPEAAATGPAVDEAIRRGAEGIFMTGSPLVRSQSPTIAVLAARHRIPVVYEDSAAVDAGGLMSYGPDRRAITRRTAVVVDRILKGAKPGEIPVERWDRFELVINLKTAAALGFAISPSVVALADRVIE